MLAPAWAALLFASPAAPAPLVAPDELAYQFPAEEVLRYRIKRNEQITYKGADGKATETDVEEQLLDFAPGTDGRGLHVRYREFKVVRVSAELSYKFDSAQTYTAKQIANDPLLGLFEGMIGDGYRVGFGPLGTVAVSGMGESLRRSAVRGLDGDPQTGARAAARMQAVLTDANEQAYFAAVFPVFPGGATVGSKWSRNEKFDLAGITFEQEFLYTVAAIAAGKATITLGGRYRTMVDNQYTAYEGTISGTAGFDCKLGRLLSSTRKIAIKLPNFSLSDSYELAFVKAAPVAESGPASFERALKTGTIVLARRTVAGSPDGMFPVHADDLCEVPAFFACGGDEVRVLEQKEIDGVERWRVVTGRGRTGWMRAPALAPEKK